MSGDVAARAQWFERFTILLACGAVLCALAVSSPDEGIDMLERLNEARARLERAPSPEGGDPANRLSFALELLDVGLVERAERLLDASTDAITGATDGLAVRYRALVSRAEFEEAAGLGDRLAKRAGDSHGAALAYLDLLFLRADLGRVDSWRGKRPDDDPVALLAAARLRDSLHDLDAAEDLYHRALEAGAPVRRVLLARSQLALRRNNVDESRRLALEAMKQDGLHAGLLDHWSQLLVRSGEVLEATKLYERIAELYPWDEQSHLMLGSGYARRNYSELEGQSPEAFPRDEQFLARMEKVRALLGLGDSSVAMTLLKEVSDLYPAACEAPAAMASLAWNEGEYREAERWARESMRREPAYGRAHTILAKSIEGRRTQLDVYRLEDEDLFARTAEPMVPGIGRFVLNWDALSPRHRKRLAVSLSPFKAFLPVLIEGEQTFYVKLLHERLSETPGHESLEDERISYDSRLWDDVRGCGGNDTVIGIEDVEGSILGRPDTALHELAHQVHGVFGEDDRNLIERAYTEALRRDKEKRDVFVNRYQASSVWEYFAEGVVAWETRQRNEWDVREVLRHRLAKRDPDLSRIVRRFLRIEATGRYLATALVSRAWKEIEYGRLDAARGFVERARTLAPEDESVLAASITLHVFAGEDSRARDEGLAAAARDPSSASIALAASTAIVHATADRAEARALLEESRPRVDEGRRQDIEAVIGWLQFEEGSFEEAAETFRRILAAREDEPGALQGLMNVLSFLPAAPVEQLEGVVERSVRKRAGERSVRADAAIVLARRGRDTAAREQIREGLLNAPGSDEVLAAASYVEWRAGDHEAAGERAREAIAAAGGASGCWNDLALLVGAQVLQERGDLAEVRRLVRELSERRNQPPEHVYIESEHRYRSVHRFGPLERELLADLEARLPG